MDRHRRWTVTLFAIAWPLGAAASDLPDCPDDFGPRSVVLLTVSPGTSIHGAFGHTALLLHDPHLDRESPVYDFGYHAGDDPLTVAWGFATGDQPYRVGRQPLATVLETYGALDRGIVAQELALTVDQIYAAADALDHILRTEASFPYHWYRPNCTSRIGDLLDQVLAGRLVPQHQGPSDTTRGRQALRSTANLPFLWFGLHWGIGRNADQPQTHWESTFMPHELMERLDASTLDGRPLVARTCRLLPELLAPMPPDAPNRDPWLAALGLGLCATLLGASSASPRAGWALTGALGVGWGLFGVLTLAVLVLGTLAPAWTGHNLPLASPLHLLLGIAAVLAWRDPTGRTPMRIAAGLAALAVAGAAFALARGFTDRNLGLLLLTLPPHLAAVWALRPRQA